MLNSIITFIGLIDSMVEVLVVIATLILIFHILPSMMAKLEIRRMLKQRMHPRSITQKRYKERYRQLQIVSLIAVMTGLTTL
jgi:uncharacterized membrane protein